MHPAKTGPQVMNGWTHTPQPHRLCPEATLAVAAGRSIADTAGVQCWRPASGTMACRCPYIMTKLGDTSWTTARGGTRHEDSECLLEWSRMSLASSKMYDLPGARPRWCSQLQVLADQNLRAPGAREGSGRRVGWRV